MKRSMFTVTVVLMLITLVYLPVFAQHGAAPDITAKGASLYCGTGLKEGVYYTKLAPEVQDQLGKALGGMTYIETQGSVDNIRLLREGKINCAIIQEDALIAEKYENAHYVGSLAKEYVQILVRQPNKERGWTANVRSIKDFDPDTTRIAIGPLGSGPNASWRAFVEQDKRYGKFKTTTHSGAVALSELESGAGNPDIGVDAVFWVSGRGGKNIQRAADSELFQIISFDDRNFNDKKVGGRRLYNFETFPEGPSGDPYRDLMPGYWWDDIETIYINAIFVVSKEWYVNNIDNYGMLYDAVGAAGKNLMPSK